MKKLFLSAVIGVCLLASVPAHAQTQASQSDLLLQIELLQKQIVLLQALLDEQSQLATSSASLDFDIDSYVFEEIDFYEGPYRAEYVVNEIDASLHLGEGGGRRMYQSVWNIFLEIADTEFAKEYVKEFRLYDDEDISHAGFVYRFAGTDHRWVLAINLADVDLRSADGREILHDLLIHEFSHILFDVYEDEQIEFTDQFWDRKDFRHAEAVEDEEGSEDVWERLDRYYERYDDEFVSEYATTNEYEDIAETFTFFVNEKEPRHDNNERNEKLLFLHNIPEFVLIRERIRDVLSL